jgi:hypothetical protein
LLGDHPDGARRRQASEFFVQFERRNTIPIARVISGDFRDERNLAATPGDMAID